MQPFQFLIKFIWFCIIKKKKFLGIDSTIYYSLLKAFEQFQGVYLHHRVVSICSLLLLMNFSQNLTKKKRLFMKKIVKSQTHAKNIIVDNHYYLDSEN